MPDFQGLRVLVLESRRSRELAALVTTYGGRPLAAPALREIPLESNSEALAFAADLIDGRIDIVVLLTGVGARALLDVVAHAGRREAFVAALARVKVAARGPKPNAVLRELGVTPWVVAPEPNTWRELVGAIDGKIGARGARGATGAIGAGLAGLHVAVQEYGADNPELRRELEARGARVTRVPVYRWALPEDVEPLRQAVTATIAGEVEVALFTTGTQVVHFLQVADAMGRGDAARAALRRLVVASVGPSTSGELRQQGLTVDIEASHPKMGFLAREAAEQAPALAAAKQVP